jgi:predicted nucleotidyltransferase
VIKGVNDSRVQVFNNLAFTRPLEPFLIFVNLLWKSIIGYKLWRGNMKLEIIKEVHRKKREKMELLRERLLQDTLGAILEFKKAADFKEAYIFGSLSKPYQFGEFSDIDIAFSGLSSDKLPLAIGFLSRKIERDVNVVVMEKVHFAKKILERGIKWRRE